jgi:hypothetical protein
MALGAIDHVACSGGTLTVSNRTNSGLDVACNQRRQGGTSATLC